MAIRARGDDNHPGLTSNALHRAANHCLQAVAWCSLPFPQYPFPDDDYKDDAHIPGHLGKDRAPGHGAVRVQIDFWFFLFVYYGFYNVTALIWITKVFNLYSLNWYNRLLPLWLLNPVTSSGLTILQVATILRLSPNCIPHRHPVHRCSYTRLS